MLAKSAVATVKQGLAAKQAGDTTPAWNADVQAHFGPMYDRLNSPEKVGGWQTYRPKTDK